jgi:ferredoxin--NADP+ reductase
MTSRLNTRHKQDWDSIVIGAGIGGLASAAFLAVNGKKPLLLEQWEVAGGCTHVFRRKRQWEFSVGLHYLGDCGPNGQVPTMLRSLGLGDRIEFLPMDPDGFDTIIFPGKQLRVPKGWDGYLHNVLELFPREEKAIRRFIGVLRTLGEAVDHSRTPASNWEIMKMAMRAGGTASAWAMRPLSHLIKACGLSSQAAAMLTPQFGAYGCPPSRAPVVLHAGFMDYFIKDGGWYPKGGSQEIVAHLLDVIQTHGGSVRTGVTVKQILVEGGRVKGVTLDSGETLHAEVVVSNADLKRTYLDMIGPEHLSLRTKRRVENYRMTKPFLNVYLGVDMDLKKSLPATNFYSCPTWDESDKLFNELVEKPMARSREEFLRTAMQRVPAFVHSPNLTDRNNTLLAPKGCTQLQIMGPAPSAPEFWRGPAASASRYSKESYYREFKEQAEEFMIQRAEDVIPGIKNHIVWRESATPLTQERYTLSSEGSCYGIEANVWQFGPFRPRSRTEIRGLFLAGASTAWGPGIEGAFLSGMHAAAAVLNRDLDAEIHAGKIYGDSSRLTPVGKDWDALKLSRYLGGDRSTHEEDEMDEAEIA